MKKARVPRIMFAAFKSGGGKTTITCAVLKALLNKGLAPAAFKCGPDYIDPMFHSEVMGIKSRNLDLFLLSEDICRYLLAQNMRNAQIAVLEGVMGYYDGLGAKSSTASSYDLARATGTPVVLIVDCKGASYSLTALIKGFVQFRPDSSIKGIILNNLTEAMYPLFKEMIEAETGLRVLGYFPYREEYSLASRHLGLITAQEISDLQQKIEILGEQAEKTIDLEALYSIASNTEEIKYEDFPVKEGESVRLAVAKDKAFCFYYQDSLELLEKMGAAIHFFSPLHDKKLPDCDGIIIGGGYPEVYARELAQNTEMLESIRDALKYKVPCIAECGGFMYLLEEMSDLKKNRYRMVGAIKGKAWMTERLNRFGYITLTSRNDNLLLKAGECINAHEFHYADSDANGSAFIAQKAGRNRQWECIHADRNLLAGFPHIHFWGNRKAAENFLSRCREYKFSKKMD